MSSVQVEANKYHGKSSYSPMSAVDWEACWSEDKIFFHKDAVHKQLIAFYDQLTNRQTNLRIFLPLCGKSLDIEFLRSNGHQVIGVEFARKPIVAFFKEHNIDFEVHEVPSIEGQLYMANDGSLKIYQCDFFKFKRDLEAPFDAIWDRGAFGAISHHQRQDYVDVLCKLMAPSCKILLNTFSYEEDQYAGPPYAFSDEEIRTYFGDNDFEYLAFSDVDELKDEKRQRGITRFSQETRLLSKRS